MNSKRDRVAAHAIFDMITRAEGGVVAEHSDPRRRVRLTLSMLMPTRDRFGLRTVKQTDFHRYFKRLDQAQAARKLYTRTAESDRVLATITVTQITK